MKRSSKFGISLFVVLGWLLISVLPTQAQDGTSTTSESQVVSANQLILDTYDSIAEFFVDSGFVGKQMSEWIARGSVVGILIVLCVISNLIAKRIIVASIKKLVKRSSTKWDDIILDRKVFAKLSHLAPGIVIYTLAGVTFAWSPELAKFVVGCSQVYMIFVGFFVASALLDAVVEIYRTYEVSRSIPIKSFVQVTKLIVLFVTGIVVISMIMDKSPSKLLTGLGAMTAILLLIFKDSILGLVAGIQLAANGMVARGDWIEMPKHGTDGEVLDVTLATVKVQNWDKTISTIPTYALISQSFKNWRGMSESQGRRIKRSLNIDVNSVRFCDDEMIQRYSKIQYISEYLEKKRQEISDHNRAKNISPSSLLNGRRITNLGTFRSYAEAYLRNHPMINQDLTLIVRQLAPGEHGIPIEIYCFSSDKRWAQYEDIQSDIFDHMIASVKEFDLRIFQEATGADMREGLRVSAQ